MTPRFTPVLFDLDGTIVDSAPGILASLAWMFEELRMPVPADAELRRWVGPPILDSFRDLAGLDPDRSRHALTVYRTHYREVGVLDTTPFPGVLEALRAIHAAGIPLSLATSKPESMARTILDTIGIAEVFTAITGASDDETRSSKQDVVAEALRRLTAAGADGAAPVLVGDRIHDVEGAGAHGVPTVFVTWGYGSPDEAAGAIATADTAAELLAELAL